MLRVIENPSVATCRPSAELGEGASERLDLYTVPRKARTGLCEALVNEGNKSLRNESGKAMKHNKRNASYGWCREAPSQVRKERHGCSCQARGVVRSRSPVEHGGKRDPGFVGSPPGGILRRCQSLPKVISTTTRDHSLSRLNASFFVFYGIPLKEAR
jgi:hypothetical protein